MFEIDGDKINFISTVLLKSFIIGLVLLIFSFIMQLLAFDSVVKVAYSIYKIEPETLAIVYLQAMSIFKILIFVFFLIPFLAIKWTLYNCEKDNKLV